MSYSISYLLLSCIFVLVRCNPLQRFPSSPIIQYRENYRNVPHIQPSNFESYPELYMTQNPLTTYHNIPVSLNNYVQGVHLNNILQNEINSAINTNDCEHNGIKFRRYALNPADLFIPNVVNNYFIVSPDNYQKNATKNCKKRNATEKSTLNYNSEHKRKKKCKKRKTSESTSGSGDKNKRKCSRNKEMNKENIGQTINQSINQDVKGDRKTQCKDPSQSLPDWNENKIDHSTTNTKQSSDQQINIKPPESGKEIKRKKNKSNNCQKLIKKDDSHDLSKILELFDYLNVNDECTVYKNRCTRNHNEENTQKYQPQYQIPSDFSNMAPYMMFNQQLFNTDGYFPYNFDYLYNMQQFPSAISNPPQKKPKNRRVNRRNKQKKGKGKNCDQNKIIKKPDNCDKIVELSPELIESQMTCEPVITQVEEPQIERSFFLDVLDTNNENVEESLKLSDEEEFPPVGDYYPEFHSDNIYTSKEEYDWDIFHDRHYYSSSDMSDLERERRKYDSTGDINTFQYNKMIAVDDNLKPSPDFNLENRKNKEGEKTVMNVDDKDNDNDEPNKSSEEIQFRTPPPLDFPDFKTEMINKDNRETKPETIYQANTKTDNEYKINKMSNYSNVKKADNENRNTVVDQNDVETVSGHSKVVKYGTHPNKEEQKVNTENKYNFKDDNRNSNDGKTTIVIAKSLPYPIV